MSVASDQAADAATDSAVRRDERRAAGVACGAHALHDGFTDVIFVLLPVWQREFGLGYAEVGMLRGIYAGTMATFQIPAALLAERLGAAPVLALGTALAGIGYCLAGASTGFALLVLALFVGGLGASAQHPLGSALMARAFAGPRSLKALGTYNFAGDIGKMTRAGGGRAPAHGDDVAAGGGAARRARPCRRRCDLPADAALWAGAAVRSRRPADDGAARRAGRGEPASRFRCCCRSA